MRWRHDICDDVGEFVEFRNDLDAYKDIVIRSTRFNSIFNLWDHYSSALKSFISHQTIRRFPSF